jgi:hypothetical protein
VALDRFVRKKCPVARQDEVGGVRTDSKDHVAGMITDFGIAMRGKVVQKHVACGLGVLSRRGLTVGDLIKGDNDGQVAASGIIEEEAGDLLNPFDAGFVKERRQVGVRQLIF